MSMPTRSEASEQLHRALITLAGQGQQPPCTDLVVRHLWTSEQAIDREQAVTLCTDCPIRRECGQAASAQEERHHVWGGTDHTPRPKATTTTSRR